MRNTARKDRAEYEQLKIRNRTNEWTSIFQSRASLALKKLSFRNVGLKIMKKLLTLLALLVTGTVLADEPALPDGTYTFQMPWVDYESGHSHTGRIQKYEVSVTNTEFGTMLRCDQLGANSEWSTLYDHKNRKRSVDVVGIAAIREPWHKVKTWFVDTEGKKLKVDGLWGLCKATILVELTATKQSDGSWSGQVINSFDARFPAASRLKYTMAWSLTPIDVRVNPISGSIDYDGPALQRKTVQVIALPPEKEGPTTESTPTK